MYCLKYLKVAFTLCWIQRAQCMNLGYSLDSDIAQMLTIKGYLSDEKDLPKKIVVKANENDATYILSKLSDVELLKLLNFHKRNEYDMDDIIKVTNDFKNNHRNQLENSQKASDDRQAPVFKLENKEVDPYVFNKDGDPKYNAVKKINNMVYSRPREDISAENDAKKEMFFDILIAQLKMLCCKKNKPKKSSISVITKNERQLTKPTEYIFLVINDEIISNTSDELIRVDPESLSINSSVLLLGPITTQLSDVQTKHVISRISNELSKTEYLPLLNKISEGNLGKKNSEILKSLIIGPETRRYIKPHRCNHQSKLANIYGGPKWLICTVYININTPSLYD